MEYGIKYYKAQLDEETYILIPIGIIEGYSLKNQFFSNKIYTIPLSEEDLKENRVLIDGIFSEEELLGIYEMDDTNFVKEYHFTEEKEQIIIINVKDNQLIKRKINTKALKQASTKEVYEFINNEPTILLNEESLDSLLRRFKKQVQKQNVYILSTLALENFV